MAQARTMSVIGRSLGAGILVVAVLCGVVGLARAQDAKGKYPRMAGIEQYRSANAADEIALARSAAPAAISGDAEVLILGSHGYESAVKGKNGFVCIVERSWATDFDDAEFWNPKIRAPICFNAPSVRSVLPPYLKRTEWVLASVAKEQMIDRTKSAIAAKTWPTPEPGAMCYMLSKEGYLGDGAGHWHPHLMFFYARTEDSVWGANLKGSPVLAHQSEVDRVTVFFIPVLRWSDGTLGPTEMP